jgi:hypothetical protein
MVPPSDVEKHSNMKRKADSFKSDKNDCMLISKNVMPCYHFFKTTVSQKNLKHKEKEYILLSLVQVAELRPTPFGQFEITDVDQYLVEFPIKLI